VSAGLRSGLRIEGFDVVLGGLFRASAALRDVAKPIEDALDHARDSMRAGAKQGRPPDDADISGYPAYTEAYAKWKRKYNPGSGWLELTGEGLSEHNYVREITGKQTGELVYDPEKADYMLIHQTGFSGTVRRGDSEYHMTIPARPHFGWNREAVSWGYEHIKSYIIRNVGVAFSA